MQIRERCIFSHRVDSRLINVMAKDQLHDVFNHEHLKALIRILFRLPESDAAALNERRRRLLPLCYETIATLNNPVFARQLAPEIWRVILKEKGPLPGIRTVYYRSLVQE